MIRRQLLRRSRLLTQSPPSRTISQTTSPFLIRQAQPLSSIFSQPPRIPQRRWQTTETQYQPAEATPESSSGAASSPTSDSAPAQQQQHQPAPADDPLEKDLEAKSREIIDLKDKYLRSVADFRNLQERTKRDIESSRQFAIQRFATDLIESIDNLDRALGSVPPEALDPEATSTSTSTASGTTASSTVTSTDAASADAAEPANKDLLNLHAGLRMTESILMGTLKKHGLERFDPQDGGGRKFDPKLDEATFMTKVEGRENGDVFHTQSKGFVLNGRVIRPAKVGVVKNS